MVCAFSGHRPHRLPWGDDEEDLRCQALKRQLDAAVSRAAEDGFDTFLCGMAMGCDYYFFDAVQALRAERPALRLEAVLPCEGQADRWPERWRARYEAALRQADAVQLLQRDYTEGCMLRRNRAMINRASLLISVYDGCGGGTGAAVRYARSRRVPVLALWR